MRVSSSPPRLPHCVCVEKDRLSTAVECCVFVWAARTRAQNTRTNAHYMNSGYESGVSKVAQTFVAPAFTYMHS